MADSARSDELSDSIWLARPCVYASQTYGFDIPQEDTIHSVTYKKWIGAGGPLYAIQFDGKLYRINATNGNRVAIG